MRFLPMSLLGLVVAMSSIAWPARSQAAPGDADSGSVTVILVRHAEKADTGYDTELSPAGRQRAQDLVPALRDAGITAILVSAFRRTQQTAQPIAAALGLTPEVVPSGVSIADHVRLLNEAVARKLPGVVLVVGHTNTLPAVMAAFHGIRIPEICDAVYDNVFVLYETDHATRTVRARYGARTPDDQALCR